MESVRPLVLLVEDDANTREILADWLRHEEFDVVEARDGIDALAVLYARLPTIVLVDLVLPTLSGLELIEQLRHASPLARLPIVAMSAWPELLHRAGDSVTAVLAKPLDLDALGRILNDYRAMLPEEMPSPRSIRPPQA